MTLGERILKLRKAEHMSQEELAECVEVSKQSVSKWELDKAVPNVEKVIRLCDVFDISTDYLLRGEAAAVPSDVEPEKTALTEEEGRNRKERGRLTEKASQRKIWKGLLWLSICVTIIMAVFTCQIVIVDTIGSKGDTERKLAVVGEIYTQLTLADVTSYTEEAGFVTRRLWLDLDGVHTGDYIYGYVNPKNPGYISYPYHSSACVGLAVGLGIALVCSGIFGWLVWKSRKEGQKEMEANTEDGEADE
ncbi:MAG: helix-turn-helix domain-containing protein [Bacteroides sp.]|nr:helix-turn-helix domain-containing protein [Bacteroides sp.]MCM1549686.1 helix-turn-helix domain-containing protein [Clostridium sp.]